MQICFKSEAKGVFAITKPYSIISLLQRIQNRAIFYFKATAQKSVMTKVSQIRVLQ